MPPRRNTNARHDDEDNDEGSVTNRGRKRAMPVDDPDWVKANNNKMLEQAQKELEEVDRKLRGMIALQNKQKQLKHHIKDLKDIIEMVEKNQGKKGKVMEEVVELNEDDDEDDDDDDDEDEEEDGAKKTGEPWEEEEEEIEVEDDE